MENSHTRLRCPRHSYFNFSRQRIVDDVVPHLTDRGPARRSRTTETVRDAAQCASPVLFGRRIRELSEHADCVFQAMIETILAVRQSV